jgi:hypothetical protein
LNYLSIYLRDTTLEGQYPDLRAGLFTIGLDFDKGKANVWYGPKQENLGQCSLSVKEVAAKIKDIRSQIGSKIGEEELIKKIQEAAFRSMGKDFKGAVPLTNILTELAFSIQSSKFRQDPKKENFESYSRADFSYDLFRIRQAQHGILTKQKLHLIVATRGHTRKREDFLWVPEDLRGKGTAYSHLEISTTTLSIKSRHPGEFS